MAQALDSTYPQMLKSRGLRSVEKLQVDPSGCSLGFVNIKTKVTKFAFQNMNLIHKLKLV